MRRAPHVARARYREAVHRLQSRAATPTGIHHHHLPPAPPSGMHHPLDVRLVAAARHAICATRGNRMTRRDDHDVAGGGPTHVGQPSQARRLRAGAQPSRAQCDRPLRHLVDVEYNWGRRPHQFVRRAAPRPAPERRARPASKLRRNNDDLQWCSLNALSLSVTARTPARTVCKWPLNIQGVGLKCCRRLHRSMIALCPPRPPRSVQQQAHSGRATHLFRRVRA